MILGQSAPFGEESSDHLGVSVDWSFWRALTDLSLSDLIARRRCKFSLNLGANLTLNLILVEGGIPPS